jgi:carbon storage regulator
VRNALRASTRMLVFTRKKGESLIIANEIEVTILNVGTGNVKVGITAPRQISVHRHEVFEAIKRENLAASRSQIPKMDILKKLLK